MGEQIGRGQANAHHLAWSPDEVQGDSICGTSIADRARYHNRDLEIPPEPAKAGTFYTCPMHPEVRQDRPGACPICGMGLEPLAPTACLPRFRC